MLKRGREDTHAGLIEKTNFPLATRESMSQPWSPSSQMAKNQPRQHSVGTTIASPFIMTSMRKFLDWWLVSLSFVVFLGVNALFIYAVGAYLEAF